MIFLYLDTMHLLNCAYDGPPKSADQEQIEILREVCPHLIPEVRILETDARSTRIYKIL